MADAPPGHTGADDVGSKPHGTLRLCVGTPSSPLSTVWKLYVRGDDIYIFSSGLGSDLKASIHASGSAHWSVSAQWFLRRGLEFHNQDRHIVCWARCNPEPTKAAHIFRIILPATELRPRIVPAKAERITWLAEPPASTAWEIEIYLTPPRPDAPNTSASPYRQLALLKTQTGGWVAVLAHQEEVTPEKRRTLLEARRDSRSLVAQSSLKPGQFLAVGFLQSAANPPGLIELVLRQSLLRCLVARFSRWWGNSQLFSH